MLAMEKLKKINNFLLTNSIIVTTFSTFFCEEHASFSLEFRNTYLMREKYFAKMQVSAEVRAESKYSRS